MRFVTLIVFLGLGLAGVHAQADWRRIGEIHLQGLSKNSGSINPPGYAEVITCNLTDGSGSDSWVALREGPGTNYRIKRKIERLAQVVVDSYSRDGNWIYVTSGRREYDKYGNPQGWTKDLGLEGYMSLNYLCDYYAE